MEMTCVYAVKIANRYCAALWYKWVCSENNIHDFGMIFFNEIVF